MREYTPNPPVKSSKEFKRKLVFKVKMMLRLENVKIRDDLDIEKIVKPIYNFKASE